jgi:sulfotransferase family protein
MALPTFFVIGAAKAGTTSLHHYLSQHPEIQMSANKEPNFFGGPENGIPYPPRHVSRREDYEALFDASVAVRGEASAGYSNHPRRRGVPQRIKRLIPDARFIYMVRDPIARTVSHYQDAYAIGKQRQPLAAAIDEALADPCSPLISHSRYATQLELYLEHFDACRIIVIDQAELLAKRRSTLAKIFAFLGVQESFDTPAFDNELYRSEDRHVYPASYWRFIERIVSPATRRVPASLRRSLRRTVERRMLTQLQSATLDGERRAALEELYREEATRLRALTGEPFASWTI